MNTKLTFNIKDIIIKNRYTDIVVKNKENDEESKISNAHVRFRYAPKTDQAYLCFGSSNTCTTCEVNDSNINEVMIDEVSLTIETDTTTYYCHINQEKLFY